MLLEQIKNIFNCSKLEISERLKIVKISCVCNKNIFENSSLIKNLLLKFPERDNVDICFEDSAENEIIFSEDKFPKNDMIEDFLNDTEDNENITVKIEITKTVENCIFSIYSFEDFANDLNSLLVIDFLKAISEIFSDSNQGIVFDMLDESKMFWSKSLKFIPHSQLQTNINLNDRNSYFEYAENNIFFRNFNDIRLLPIDFILESDYDNNLLTKKFDICATIMSLVYIANSSNITTKQLDIQLIGQQTISESIILELIQPNKNIINIFSWIYDCNFSSDKLMITRNIISLHCKHISLTSLDERTLASIHSNFNLYLKDNVDRYLNLKKEVSTFLYDIVSKTSEYSLIILKSLKSNLTAMIAFLLTVVLSNIGSVKPLNNIFTKDITTIIEVIVLGSFIFMLISIFEHNSNMKSIEDSYKLLKNSYEEILSKEDIKEIFDDDKIKKETFKKVKYWRNIYIIIWTILLVGIVILIETLSNEPIIIKILHNVIIYVLSVVK